MEVADHVGKRAVGAHVEMIRMALHAGEPDAEHRMLADDVGCVAPDKKSILRAGIFQVEPSEAPPRLEPQACGDDCADECRGRGGPNLPTKLLPDDVGAGEQ